jgi:ABC-type multidrug transport system fused ATPase/permease subunit
LIDDIDISKVGLQRLRSKVTVIPQDPTLFKGSLWFNIDPTGSQPDDVINSLVKRAGLDDLLLKSNTDFQIKESGSNLSSGEKQLICICRAILRNAKIVILDEATSNIDVMTEQRILSLMTEELADSTVITIAHRLNTVITSDQVLVLSEGRVVEFGSPDKLSGDKDSHFSKLLQELRKV